MCKVLLVQLMQATKLGICDEEMRIPESLCFPHQFIESVNFGRDKKIHRRVNPTLKLLPFDNSIRNTNRDEANEHPQPRFPTRADLPIQELENLHKRILAARTNVA
jgi:hypothetical protein